MSPNEIRIACCHAIAKIARDLNEAVVVGQTQAAGADLTEKTKPWRHRALTCAFKFSALASEDEVVNQRENLATDYSTLAATAYQRIYQALAVKARAEEVLDPVSAARAAEELSQQAKLAADSEPVAVGKMNAIILIHQHALKVLEIVAVLEQCERRFIWKSFVQPHQQAAHHRPECGRSDQTKHNLLLCVCCFCLKSFFASSQECAAFGSSSRYGTGSTPAP